ncbi:hypothetical protein IAT38_002444 [Cryptococcus sp. DSM 104549]
MLLIARPHATPTATLIETTRGLVFRPQAVHYDMQSSTGDTDSGTVKRFPLLLLCKRTMYIAGELLYTNLFTTTYINRNSHKVSLNKDRRIRRAAPLAMALLGLEKKRRSKLSPFGRSLKLHFLGHTVSWTHAPADNYGAVHEADSPFLTVAARTAIEEALCHLQQSGTPPFPNLQTLAFAGIDDYGVAPLVDLSGRYLALAAVCTPRRRIIWHKVGHHDSQSISTVAFANGHLPETSTFYYGLSSRKNPPVCHGMRNDVVFNWQSKDIFGALEAVGKVLDLAHPELAQPMTRDFSVEELERRRKTTWRFVWLHIPRRSNHPFWKASPKNLEAILKAIEKKNPSMKGRVETSVIETDDESPFPWPGGEKYIGGK